MNEFCFKSFSCAYLSHSQQIQSMSNTLDLHLSHTGIPYGQSLKVHPLRTKKKESPGLGLVGTKINAVCKVCSDIWHKYHE